MVIKSCQGGILLADMSQVLEFFRVILFIAFHIEDISRLSLTKYFSLFELGSIHSFFASYIHQIVCYA